MPREPSGRDGPKKAGGKTAEDRGREVEQAESGSVLEHPRRLEVERGVCRQPSDEPRRQHDAHRGRGKRSLDGQLSDAGNEKAAHQIDDQCAVRKPSAERARGSLGYEVAHPGSDRTGKANPEKASHPLQQARASPPLLSRSLQR